MGGRSAVTRALLRWGWNPTIVVFLFGWLGFGANIIMAINWGIDRPYLLSFFVIVQTLLVILLFTPLHDAVHKCASPNRFLNESILHLLWPVFLNAPALFRKIHLTHHAHTNQGLKDPDHFTSAHSWSERWARSFFLIFYYYVFSYRNYSKDRRMWIWMNFSVFIPLLIIGVALFHPLGGVLTLVWFIPAFIGIGVLAFINTSWPHHPGKEVDRHLNTRLMLVPKPLEWLMLHQNLHLVHHLRPTIPWYEYPAYYEAHREELLAKGAVETDYRGLRIVQGLRTGRP